MYVLAIVFGAAAGVLLSVGPVRDLGARLRLAAAAVAWLVALATAMWVIEAPAGVVMTMALVPFPVMFLVGGLMWKDHPLLAGKPFFERATTVFFHQRHLRQVSAEVDRAEFAREGGGSAPVA